MNQFVNEFYKIIETLNVIRGLNFHKYSFKQINTSSSVINLYNSLVKSVLMYDAIIWNSKTKLKNYEI